MLRECLLATITLGAIGCTAIAGYDDREPMPAAATEVCEDPGAVAHEGRCYFAIEPESWSDARAACEALGARLVTISSRDEDDVVRALPGGDKWIGLSRGATTLSPFRGVDGSEISYDGFRSGEPNGSGRCARMTDGGWADWDCDARYAAVCERE